MKKYDLHKIMKAAHEIYRKYFKLYQLTHGVQTFGDCLKLAWANDGIPLMNTCMVLSNGRKA